MQAPPAAIPRQDNLELTELTAITPLDGSAVTEGLCSAWLCLVARCAEQQCAFNMSVTSAGVAGGMQGRWRPCAACLVSMGSSAPVCWLRYGMHLIAFLKQPASGT